jgi:hypothetical protein
MLMDTVLSANKSKRSMVLSEFVMRTAMLREAPLSHFGTMLVTMICPSNTKLFIENIVRQDPMLLSVEDATAIGASVEPICLRHIHAAKAVAELMRRYPALRSMAENKAWFEPFISVVVSRLMEASGGTKLRVSFGMLMAFIDVVSDLGAIVAYFSASQPAIASAIMAMVLLSVTIQALIVFVRNMHRRKDEIAKELLIVLSFFKPVVDLYRLIMGHEIDGAPFDTAMERNICRVIESICESIPTSMIIIVGILSVGEWSWLVLLSVLISWVSTALKTATLSLDMDEDRHARDRDGWFYGFAPNGSPRRASLMFGFLFLLALTHVAGKTVAISLLFVTDNALCFGWLVVEMASFLLYKIVRKDFFVWLPQTGIAAAFIYRVLSKLMLDFTGLPQMRHPKECGGFYFAITMALNQVVCLMAGWAYSKYYQGPNKLEPNRLFATLGVLAAVWALSLCGFLLSINRKYVRTFVSFETGRACTIRFFRENAARDAIRIQIINNNELTWNVIRPAVREWFRENFLRWKAERLAWLTTALLDRLPDDFLPPIALSGATSISTPITPRVPLLDVPPRRRSTIQNAVAQSLLRRISLGGAGVEEALDWPGELETALGTAPSALSRLGPEDSANALK